MRGILRLAAGVLLASAAWAGGRFTAKQLAARFYYDLGPEEIDVSGYPKAQRENYAAFAATCARCHTLARPINAPIAARRDWERYVARMRVRTKVAADKSFTREQAKKVVDFLAYDSQIRKVRGRAAFEAQTRQLKVRFAEVAAERARLRIEGDRRKAHRRI
ncbi:MAG: hypothetical protein HY552_03755 [Elusimicrobia bacterium]|nr:hypothetical protein [Elusimicrobiota bacterium]